MIVLLIIFAVLLFNLIIFLHELGHFFWAKKFGVQVNEFALGMGPRVFKFKKGETLFSLRALPIGGFCEMEGEDERSDNPKSFENKKAWQKIIIIASGGIMNLILGFALTFILLAQSPAIASTTIRSFENDAVSSSTGLMTGDEILKINNSKIYAFKDIAFNISAFETSDFDVEVRRDNQIVNLKNVNFKTVENTDGSFSPGIDFLVEPIEKNFINLIKCTFSETASTIKIVWRSLGGLVTGKISFKKTSGPIGIASEIGKITNEGLKSGAFIAVINIINIMAIITINLGIFNLLPLPALDGGRLVFLFVELITGKKVNPKYEGIIHTIGFVLFILFMIWMSYSDILKLIGKS
ncbi:MAG: M50 family metallopeptidase [Acutalibacteraceae bacterium]